MVHTYSYYSNFHFFQREISNAADIAARRYRELTPEPLRTAPEVWEVMTKAQEKLIKSIRNRNFEKFISVAHKDNGEEFFQEVRCLPFLLIITILFPCVVIPFVFQRLLFLRRSTAISPAS